MIAWQPEDTPEALKVAYQRERDRQRRTQLHGLWLLRCGWTLAAVAEAVGAHYRSAVRWAGWYRRGGLTEVRRHRMGGQGHPARLTADQQQAVADAVATGRFRTGEELRDWIAEQYGVVYRVSGIYSLLKRLRCRPKVPRPVHAKADPARQAAWKQGSSGRRSLRPA